LWLEWPQWDDEHTFRTPNLTFVSIASTGGVEPYSDGRVPVRKPRQLLDCYRDVLHGRNIRSIAEIGYLYGGMVLFLADARSSAAKWRKEYKRISSSRTWRTLSRLNRGLMAARNSVLGRSSGRSEDKV
jgi:hypothetical protein